MIDPCATIPTQKQRDTSTKRKRVDHAATRPIHSLAGLYYPVENARSFLASSISSSDSFVLFVPFAVVRHR